jgi:hypothetical protein
MHVWEQILLVVGMLGVGYWTYTIIKRNPDSFSKENLGKSFYTMGLLAIILIAFIAVCIWLLKTSS